MVKNVGKKGVSYIGNVTIAEKNLKLNYIIADFVPTIVKVLADGITIKTK